MKNASSYLEDYSKSHWNFHVFFGRKMRMLFFYHMHPVCSVYFNFSAFINKPILLGYVGGKTGRLLETHVDEKIIEGVVQDFKSVFRQNATATEKYFITRWAQDPWSFGSYSYIPVGATREDRDVLAEPEHERLFFAGEATSKQFPATVHGPYLVVR